MFQRFTPSSKSGILTRRKIAEPLRLYSRFDWRAVSESLPPDQEAASRQPSASLNQCFLGSSKARMGSTTPAVSLKDSGATSPDSGGNGRLVTCRRVLTRFGGE